MTTFEKIIGDLGGTKALAKALSVPESHARTMKARKSIPVRYWKDLVAAAAAASITGVSYETLVELATQRENAE